MRAKIDTATKTLTIQYEDDIDLLILWAHLDINRADMIKAPKSADLSLDNKSLLDAKSCNFSAGAYPVWDVLDDHLVAARIIIRP